MDSRQLIQSIVAAVVAAITQARDVMARVVRDVLKEDETVRDAVRRAMQTESEGRGKRPYLIEISVDFDGTASEEKPISTPAIDQDVVIIGAITNLSAAKVKINDNSTGQAWSASAVSVLALAGKVTNTQPVLMWPTPYELGAKQTLLLEFKNAASGMDAAGFFTLICEQKKR